MLRYKGILHGSRANGPGSRTVLFTQGCWFKCSGCQNQELWPSEGGILATPEVVAGKLLEEPCDGWTITGGEPLAQLEATMGVLDILRDDGRGVILFTGYSREELFNSLELTRAVSLCDAVISGRFQKRNACHKGLKGSSNQEILCVTGRYNWRQLEEFPHCVEIHANPPVITGFPGGE